MTTGIRPAVPLLTFHPDRLDRVPTNYLIDGDPVAGHWLLQDAINEEVITWDRTVWGDPLFHAQLDSSPRELSVGYTVDGLVTLTRGVDVEVPDPDLDDPDPDPDDDVAPYPKMPDPTHRPAEFLALIVDALNTLHADTERLVAAWPGTTGTPLLRDRHGR